MYHKNSQNAKTMENATPIPRTTKTPPTWSRVNLDATVDWSPWQFINLSLENHVMSSIICIRRKRFKKIFMLTLHAPPPSFCSHHFCFNCVSTPFSCSRRTASLNSPLYSASRKNLFSPFLHWISTPKTLHFACRENKNFFNFPLPRFAYL